LASALPPRGHERSLCGFQPRLLLMKLRCPLLGVLHSACAIPRQSVVTGSLLLCESQASLRLLHLRVALGHLGLLDGGLCIDVLDAGLRGRHLRLRLLQRDAVVAIVDAGDHVAGGDMLIVGDRDGCDVA
jgi:hypothetical protein